MVGAAVCHICVSAGRRGLEGAVGCCSTGTIIEGIILRRLWGSRFNLKYIRTEISACLVPACFIDQGTTSSRAIVFQHLKAYLWRARSRFKVFPQGWPGLSDGGICG
jgi:hypothetical protein